MMSELTEISWDFVLKTVRWMMGLARSLGTCRHSLDTWAG